MKEGHASFEVEAATVVTLNLLTFQLYKVHRVQSILYHGDIHPPNDSTGVDDLQTAWAVCLDDCVPLVLGNLNINFGHPQDYREKQRTNLPRQNKPHRQGNMRFVGVGCNWLRSDGRGTRGG
jgi:hypothetical protein